MKKIKISELPPRYDAAGQWLLATDVRSNSNSRVDFDSLNLATTDQLYAPLAVYARHLYYRRNLLLDTNRGAKGWAMTVDRAYVNNYATYGYNDNIMWGATAKQCVLDDPAANRTPWEMFSRELRPELIKAGYGYRLTFDMQHDAVVSTDDFSIVISISNADNSQRLVNDVTVRNLRQGNNHISVMLYGQVTGVAGGTQKLWIRVNYNKDVNPGGSRWQALSFKDIRLVIENEETPWQPAPEDLGLPATAATYAVRRSDTPPMALPDDFQMAD